ncbi:TetR family transcriptional regulator C-terminal domain-containing protein [Pseudonocardia sp. DLS-67]
MFALQLVIDRATARVASVLPLPTAGQEVEAVAAELLPLDRERRAEMEVYLALFTAASSNAGLRAVRDAAHRTTRDACRWMIGRLDDASDLAEDADRELESVRLHAVIDGLAAHLIYEPADADPGWARQVLVRHIRSLREVGRDGADR